MALAHVGEAHWQLSPAALVEEAIQQKEGALSQEGALVCDTGKFTGRSPRDKSHNFLKAKKFISAMLMPMPYLTTACLFGWSIL
jgi:ATP-dependent phosphoenolpyruvate carboxykinase